jgi:NADPH-dependent 2,4-dienoyl-CoA reductase/sulfur reductase-like enzyme
MSIKQTDVLIVGAGPAGLASAIQLKKQGAARVTVVDREPEPGGMPRLCHHTGFGLWDFHRLYTGPQYARRYAALARSLGVEILTETTITGWADEHALTYTSPQGMGAIVAPAILLATGVRERPRAARLTPGFRPRGIFTTGSLQRFVDEQHLPVGRRAVIIGAEGVSLSALMTLTGAGVAVAAMLTELPRHQMYFPYSPAKWWLMDVTRRTPVRTRVRVKRILGRGRVTGVEIEHLDSGRLEHIACDTVVYTGDWIPEHEVARKGRLLMDAGTSGPQVDAQFRTSLSGVFAAGNLLRGAETAATSAMEGRLAAQHIADFLQGRAWPQQRLPILAAAPITWVFPNSISAPETTRLPRFSFRVSQFMGDVVVQVRQGQKLLHQQRFRHLLPNETMHLSSAWLLRVAAHGGPVRVEVAG